MGTPLYVSHAVIITVYCRGRSDKTTGMSYSVNLLIPLVMGHGAWFVAVGCICMLAAAA